MEQYNAAVEYNSRLLNELIDMWTAFAFPALYFAKKL
jgi:hypothetical protein